MNENSSINPNDLVELSLQDLKESVLRAANVDQPAVRPPVLQDPAAAVPEAVKVMLSDCAILEGNCNEYRKALDLVAQEVRSLRKRLDRSEAAAKEASKFKTLLKAELLRSRQLDIENARLSNQNAELISVMKQALLAPDDSVGQLQTSQIEVECLREENTRLRELLSVISEYDTRLASGVSNPISPDSARSVTRTLDSFIAPPPIVLVTPPRSPEGHRFTVITSPRVCTSQEDVLSQPSTPEEELADLGPQVDSLQLDTISTEEDDPSGCAKVDFTLNDSHALPSVTSPKVSSISPNRRLT